MEIREYQNEIKRTLNNDLSEKEQIINMSLGLCGESGEVADIIKKAYFQGHELDRIKLINETGDICWYLFNLLNILGVDAREVFEYNISKLQKRYKEGFSAADSIKRVDTNDEI